ncbi:hypothetical protein AWENTII_005252 [Aspergillus wentii]
MQLPVTFCCMHETRKTSIGFLQKSIIVSKESAGLPDHEAIPVENTDHHTICRCKNANSPSYRLIIRELRSLKDKLCSDSPER